MIFIESVWFQSLSKLVILDSMRADGGTGTSYFSQAVLSPSSLYLYVTIVLCFFNFCLCIAVNLCLCLSLRSCPVLTLAIFSCDHTYAILIANPVLLHSDPFRCFLYVDPLGFFFASRLLTVLFVSGSACGDLVGSLG
jgi:hypothetical protein